MRARGRVAPCEAKGRLPQLHDDRAERATAAICRPSSDRRECLAPPGLSEPYERRPPATEAMARRNSSMDSAGRRLCTMR